MVDRELPKRTQKHPESPAQASAHRALPEPLVHLGHRLSLSWMIAILAIAL
jgi:hypothetical protein